MHWHPELEKQGGKEQEVLRINNSHDRGLEEGCRADSGGERMDFGGNEPEDPRRFIFKQLFLSAFHQLVNLDQVLYMYLHAERKRKL